METKYKYLIYFEEKQFNTNKVKKHIKDYVLENGALYALE